MDILKIEKPVFERPYEIEVKPRKKRQKAVKVDSKVDAPIKVEQIEIKLLPGQYIKDGCIAEDIMGYECLTPPIPKDLRRVDGYDIKNPIEQKFRKTQIPEWMSDDAIQKVFDAKNSVIDIVLDKRQQQFKEREEDRIWIDGYWFFNNGVLTWIHGFHYFELNYWNIGAETDDGLKEYRDADRRFWFFWRDIEINETEYGVTEPKFRRKGASMRGFAMNYLYARKGLKHNTGYMADDGNKAKEEFQQFFVAPFNDLPIWLRGPKEVAPDANSVTLSYKNKKTGRIQGTGSLINYKPNTIQAYNGKKLRFALIDETGKYEIDLEALLSVLKYCITLGAGGKRIGMLYIPTTVEDMEKGGTQYKKFIEDSYRETYSAVTKRTVSGFRFYFTSAEDGLEMFIGPHGESIIDDPTEKHVIDYLLDKYPGHPLKGSRRHIQESLDQYIQHGKWDLYTKFLRAHPRKLEDIFMPTSGKQVFNTQRLHNLISRLQSSSYRSQSVRRGDFQYLESRVKKQVIWIDNPASGKFVTNFLHNDWHNEANRVNWLGKEAQPLNVNKGVISVDPYEKGIVIDKRHGSKGAAHGIFFFDERNEKTKFSKESPGEIRDGYYPTPSLFLQYHARPMDIDEFYEDMVMASIYFGVEMAHENNKDGLTPHFKRRGMEAFLVPTNDFFPPEERKSERVGSYGINMGSNASICIQTLARFLNGRDDYLRGYYYDVDIEMDRFPFLSLAKDMLDFDPVNRTKYDLTMSTLPGLVLMENRLYDKMYYYETESTISDDFLDAVLKK